MNGYESPSLVRAAICALEHELRNPWSDSHAEAVRAQLAIFTTELERLEREGIEDIPANPAHGTLDPYGTWVGRP